MPYFIGLLQKQEEYSRHHFVAENDRILHSPSTGPSFGIQTNGFGFRIFWATNASVVVEAFDDPPQSLLVPGEHKSSRERVV